MPDLFIVLLFILCLGFVVWVCEIRVRQMREQRDYFKVQTYRLREQRRNSHVSVVRDRRPFKAETDLDRA
jgi:hypothetical protein